MTDVDSNASVLACLQGIAANLALVVAGNYMKWVNAAFTQGSVLLSLRYLVSTVVVMSGVMMASKLYMDANIKSIEVSTTITNYYASRQLTAVLCAAKSIDSVLTGYAQKIDLSAHVID